MAVTKLITDQILAGVCALILAGTLTAGLWPFHAPRNQVTCSQSGLHFNRYGTALSTAAFAASKDAGRTIEIWLQPAQLWYENTVLAFYSPGEPKQFSLYQSDGGLILRTDLGATEQDDPARVATLPRVFQKNRQPFITITSGTEGAAAYVDGALAEMFPHFRPGDQAFTGRLVLGTSPVDNDSWSGLWIGLAIYNRELTPAQVSHHYQSWAAKGQPDIRDDERSAAVYLFDQHSGNMVHNIVRNQVSSGIDLLIPERYMILDEKFLEPAWKEFRWRWGYWKNVLINVGGFIPLGFFFFAYFVARRIQIPGLTTIILGAAVSLTIEVLQAFLPTRDSGTTDLITNTLGTCIGVMLCRWKPNLITQTLERLLVSARLA